MKSNIIEYYFTLANDPRYLFNRYSELIQKGVTMESPQTEAERCFSIVEAFVDEDTKHTMNDVARLARDTKWGAELVRIGSIYLEYVNSVRQNDAVEWGDEVPA